MEEFNELQNSNKDINIELIVSLFKSFSDKKRAKEIKNMVCAMLYPNDLLAIPKVEEAVDHILLEDKKLAEES